MNIVVALFAVAILPGQLVPAPLSASIAGPRSVIVGQSARFTLAESGPVDSREWDVDPPVADSFITADGKSFAFNSPVDGDYQVTVLVAGIIDGKAKAARATWRVTMLGHDQADENDAPAPRGRAARAMGGADPAEVIKRALRAVTSDDRRIDAKIVADALRQVASSKSNGNLLAEARTLAGQTLPDDGHAWRSFWADVEELFADFQDQRLTPTRAHRAGAMLSVAKILEAEK